MFGKSFELFKIFGFAIRVDVSWFVVALLISWSLANSYFPTTQEGLSSATYWIMGVIGALGLFASVVLHELSHSLVARRFGLAIRGITLFIFGGVAEMEREPPDPKAEFMVAVAGPIASLAIGVGCFALTAVGVVLGWPAPATGVLSYLALINVVLVIFNSIPAFPLDGGRILRSLLWHSSGNLRAATKTTSRIGSGFGLFLILFGVFRVVYWQDFVGGMWMFLIGMFLRNAAQMSYRQLIVRNALEGEPVSRFMKAEPTTVPRSVSIAELVENYVYRYHYKMFPVVDNGQLLGCVRTSSIKELPREEWDRNSVGTLVEPCTDENTVAPDTDAMEALSKMNRSGASRLMVVEGNRLAGILSLKDLLQFLALKVELEGDDPPAQP